MGLFIRLTALIAVVIVGLVLLAFVVKALVLAALFAGLVIAGLFTFNFLRSLARGGPAGPILPR